MSTASAISSLLQYNMKKIDIAAELGLTPSAVTQAITANPTIAEQPLLEKHARLDDKYDEIEDKLLDQLKKTIPLLLRPGEIANVLTRVNQAKRRGGPLKATQAAPTVLQLNLPVAIQNRFVLNSANQVVTAGAQDLVTIPSAAVARLAAQTVQPKVLHDAISKQTSPATSSLASELGFD